LTLADIRLFTTLVRFDVAYYGLFKCNQRRIRDYSHLSGYLRELYQLPGIAETCDFASIKADYYGNLFPLNPGGLIPVGPELEDLSAPHQRQSFGASGS
jgi:putative glutathione S-transferase